MHSIDWPRSKKYAWETVLAYKNPFQFVNHVYTHILIVRHVAKMRRVDSCWECCMYELHVYDNVRKKKKEINVCFCVCKRTRARSHSCVRACVRARVWHEGKNRIDRKEWCWGRNKEWVCIYMCMYEKERERTRRGEKKQIYIYIYIKMEES